MTAKKKSTKKTAKSVAPVESWDAYHVNVDDLPPGMSGSVRAQLERDGHASLAARVTAPGIKLWEFGKVAAPASLPAAQAACAEMLARLVRKTLAARETE